MKLAKRRQMNPTSHKK